jgi:hypothetical protein
VLGLGILSGLSGFATTPFVSPEQFTLASDVYLTAADALLSGGDIYAVTPPDRPGYHYIYPPIVVLAFLPHALLGSSIGAFAVQTALNVGAGLGITVLVVRALERRGLEVARLDWALIAGFTLFSAHSAITLINGQVTVPLAFAFAVGFHSLDQNRQTIGGTPDANREILGGALAVHRETIAGAAFAAAALVKVFPAAIGLWLLRIRARRAVAAAIATGLGGLALGALLLGPDLTVTYVQDVLLGRYEGHDFHGAPEPDETTGGAQRQIAVLTGLGSPVTALLALLVLAPAVVPLYRRIDTEVQRQAAILGTILATLLFMPLQRLYMPLFVFPLLVLLYTLPGGRARTVLVAGSLVTYLRIEYGVVAAGIESLPLPAGVESAALSVAADLFAFVLPTTLGLWILLGACVLCSRR